MLLVQFSFLFFTDQCDEGPPHDPGHAVEHLLDYVVVQVLPVGEEWQYVREEGGHCCNVPVL